MTLGSSNISERSLAIDERVGWIVTLIGIPSAFLLHGYVGFIFGSIKANPWWSSPLMPVVFIFSAMVSGIAGVMLLYMATHEDARQKDRHPLRGYHRHVPCSTSSSSTSASKCST
jgi:formate-dependent nitrite reductase membrane component NrfD